LREQEARHALGHVVGHFEANGVAEVALRQFALQRLAQVLHLLLLDEEVGVARDAELVAALHVHAGEELAHVRVQDRGEEDEVVGPCAISRGRRITRGSTAGACTIAARESRRRRRARRARPRS
jgi:hypothetical protein